MASSDLPVSKGTPRWVYRAKAAWTVTMPMLADTEVITLWEASGNVLSPSGTSRYQARLAAERLHRETCV